MKKVVVSLQTEKLSNFVEGMLESEDFHLAVGYWGCGNCSNNFFIPNANYVAPRYCPFCGSHDIISQ